MNKLLLLVFPVLLFGCNQPPTISELCENNLDTCQLFTPDSWCKAERKKMIWAFDIAKTSDIEKSQYDLLITLENYRECMGYASQIEHIKLKEKKTFRLKNKKHAIDKINEISEATEKSTNPYLLYYHWSRYLNKTSLQKFIRLEGSNELETTELQFFLATYYIKRDIQKTFGLLFHALELYNTDTDIEIDVEIFKSIISLFTDKEEYKQAYIWLKILQLYKPDDKDITAGTLPYFAKLHKLDNVFLDKVAEATLDKILQGEFIAPHY